ncbi:RNase J family beta-CASP ribonuclease [Candidatus Woesearchaeota archaeon]|jgi:ribonuclease J|nr:RNase J family beta-CASP ribonuclease [Candidatus Woesearchaeota archaeon]MBT6520248.1 RNase J family beta-CASP ribonuclease [Candidatus Woesearchaeota archaeon]
MTIQICTVGGYEEVGKNMTAIKVDDEVVIIDMGLYLDAYVKYTEDEDVVDMSSSALMKIGAIPDTAPIKDWKKKVLAIIPTHAHLDHVGAIPYLGKNFNAPVFCTPFTGEILSRICKDEKITLKNEIKILNVNSTYKVSEKIKIEFVNMTHSTPQTVMAVIHTPYGKIVYGNDFKFDDRPVLGKKPAYDRLKRLNEDGEVICLIVDCTRAADERKTPSEQVARDMLRDVMLGCDSEGKAIIVTTFSSHIARLKSIVDFGKKLKRKIVFLGRSLSKYVGAAEAIGIVNFSNDVKIVGFKKKIKKQLKEIQKDPSKYLIVCTGHQGEAKSVLSRIATGEFDFKLGKEDHVIFSCTIIPTPLNYANRKILEDNIKKKGVRLFKEIHVSGHAAREDLRDLINMVKPKHIIPAHGDLTMKTALVELAEDIGYNVGETIHMMRDGQMRKFE